MLSWGIKPIPTLEHWKHTLQVEAILVPHVKQWPSDITFHRISRFNDNRIGAVNADKQRAVIKPTLALPFKYLTKRVIASGTVDVLNCQPEVVQIALSVFLGGVIAIITIRTARKSVQPSKLPAGCAPGFSACLYSLVWGALYRSRVIRQ